METPVSSTSDSADSLSGLTASADVSAPSSTAGSADASSATGSALASSDMNRLLSFPNAI